MARPAGTSSPPRRDAARRKQWKDLWREHKGLREASMPDEMFFGNFPHGRAAMGVNVNLARLGRQGMRSRTDLAMLPRVLGPDDLHSSRLLFFPPAEAWFGSET